MHACPSWYLLKPGECHFCMFACLHVSGQGECKSMGEDSAIVPSSHCQPSLLFARKKAVLIAIIKPFSVQSHVLTQRVDIYRKLPTLTQH
jgi:hypothetical protein